MNLRISLQKLTINKNSKRALWTILNANHLMFYRLKKTVSLKTKNQMNPNKNFKKEIVMSRHPFTDIFYTKTNQMKY